MVMRPRDRRLQSEFDEMTSLSDASSLLSFTSVGVPPTRYTVTTSCHGLMRWGGRIITASHHQFDIDLDEGFPLVPPSVVWRTPVFHPNIKPPHVCMGDIWYPGFSLAQFCVEICHLIQYKSFNIYDPLDDEAGLWLAASLRAPDPEIPVDDRPIIDLEFAISPRPVTAEGGEDAETDG